MNKIFSEIFGCYYNIVTQIVNNAPLTESEIIELINKNGFNESCFYLLPKLKELPFIKFQDGKYYSLLENKIKMPLTNLEKSWLKAISTDERFKLFHENFNYQVLEDVEPLYEKSIFRYFDKYSDGDDFENDVFVKNFRKINEALEQKRIVKIVYKSPKNSDIKIGYYVPVKFEFSAKDDKFRIFAAKIYNGKINDYVCLNMNRIVEVRITNEEFKNELRFENHIEKFDCDEPVLVEIYDERNAIERFMVEFSTYKKESEFDEEKNLCKSKIYYRKTDENEVLIKLLSFGPVIKVLGHQNFLKLFKGRIKRQKELIK